MIAVYYYLVLVSAAVSAIVGVVAFAKNRYQAAGAVLGLTFLGTAVWLVGFAHYYYPMDSARALWWGKVTLSAAMVINPMYFQSMVTLVGQARRQLALIILGWIAAVMLIVLIWQGWLIKGLQFPPYMAHYIAYNRSWYPVILLHIVGWQLLGAGVMIHSIWRAVGYQRMQSLYYLVAWLIIFFTTSSIITPIEYHVNIPPFGFWLLPFNLALLAYVFSKARLTDFNVIAARVFLHAVTLTLVAGLSLLFVGGLTLLKPGFLNQEQVTFMVLVVTVIALILAATLPRFLPRAERLMQERLFGTRYGYQDAIAGLVKQLSLASDLDAMLGVVVNTLHAQMQLSRGLIFLRDPISADYQLRSQSGLNREQVEEMHDLEERSAIIRHLLQTRDALVRDELPQRVDETTRRFLTAEMDAYEIVVCVPMILDDKLVGLISLGEKTSRNMFFLSDLRLLETLATEVALALKYRRIEEEISRKNKLAELGTIAAGVAHEIRNPLASIKTFAQLLPEKFDDADFRNEFGQLVLNDVDRITKVVDSMLAFARPSQVTQADHPVTELVEAAVVLTQARINSKKIELVREFHAEPVVKVDKQQILQVLINLINNAVDVLPEHGTIHLVTGIRWIEANNDGGQRQQFGVIEVSDNGPGIPLALRSRLFDPFFTTKKDGTGLGLSISQKITRDHGGVITVSSIEGKGATFQINLPLE